MLPLQPRTIATHALISVAFNAVLAACITLAGFHGFWDNMVYSQLIGFSIFIMVDGGRFLLSRSGYPGKFPMMLLVLASVLAGYFGGSAVGDMVLGNAPLHGMERAPQTMVGFLLMSLAAGGFGAYYFTSREQLARARLAHEEAQRHVAEAQLKLLQTQLEPHMLFNTLANLRALIDTNPAQATHMLDRMVAYLRATLGASRASLHPLEAEFERLRDYLELMAVRMGPRLRFTLDLPSDLRQTPVPPLLLQPIVENAIKHGLEPKREGGTIHVRAERQGNALNLDVVDNGMGASALAAVTVATASPQAGGFGLQQVRERLLALYGPAATMGLSRAEGGGTRVFITIPLSGQAA